MEQGFDSLMRQLWLVWLLAIFVGICVWAMWPARKPYLDRQARIPIDDDLPATSAGALHGAVPRPMPGSSEER